MNSKNRAVRIAINFDLSTKVLEEIFGTGNTSKPYSDIKHFMETNGFMHRQYSGYVSVEPKTEADIALLAMKMNEELPWFGRAVEGKEIDVTEIGKVYSIKDYYINSDKDIQKQDLGSKIMENQNKDQDFLFMSSGSEKALEEAHLNNAKLQIIEAMDMQKLARIDSSIRSSGVNIASDKPNFGDTKDYLMSMSSDEFTTLLLKNNAFDTRSLKNDDLLKIDELIKAQRNMAIELISSKDSVAEKEKAIAYLKQTNQNEFILKGIDDPNLDNKRLKELAEADVFVEEKNKYLTNLALKGDEAIKEASKKNAEKTNSIFGDSLNWFQNSIQKYAMGDMKKLLETIASIVRLLTDKDFQFDQLSKLSSGITESFKTSLNAISNEDLTTTIKKHEGYSETIYNCPAGYPTVGYGFKVSSLTKDELALNGGRAEPMSKEVSDQILELKLAKLQKQVFEEYPFLKDKPEAVQKVYMDMAYNMGMGGFSQFKSFHNLVENNKFEEASKHIMDSKYATQVGNRAVENATIIANANESQSSSIKYN